MSQETVDRRNVEDQYVKWGGDIFWIDSESKQLAVVEADCLGPTDEAAWRKEMLDTSLDMLKSVLRHYEFDVDDEHTSVSDILEVIDKQADRIFVKPLRDLDALAESHVASVDQEPLFTIE